MRGERELKEARRRVVCQPNGWMLIAQRDRQEQSVGRFRPGEGGDRSFSLARSTHQKSRRGMQKPDSKTDAAKLVGSRTNPRNQLTRGAHRRNPAAEALALQHTTTNACHCAASELAGRRLASRPCTGNQRKRTIAHNSPLPGRPTTRPPPSLMLNIWVCPQNSRLTPPVLHRASPCRQLVDDRNWPVVAIWLGLRAQLASMLPLTDDAFDIKFLCIGLLPL